MASSTKLISQAYKSVTTQAIAAELVRNQLLTKTHIGLDFFDASINWIAAWVIGTRNTIKSLRIALLEPPSLAGSGTTIFYIVAILIRR